MQLLFLRLRQKKEYCQLLTVNCQFILSSSKGSLYHLSRSIVKASTINFTNHVLLWLIIHQLD